MLYRNRSRLIVLALGLPVLAIFVATMLAARDVAREAALLKGKQAAFEAETAAQQAPRGTP